MRFGLLNTLALAGEFLHGEPAADADTMGVMDRVCAACHQPIQDQEQWFRVYEEYVRLSCAEKYLRLVFGRRQQAKTALAKA